MGRPDAFPRWEARRQDSPLLLGLAVLVSAEATAAATLLLLAGERPLAGAAAAVAGVVNVLVLPMATGFRARFAEQALDRAFEVSILGAVTWEARLASPRLAVLALVALSLSYLATYQRARGEALGYRGAESSVYSGVRALLIVAGLLTGWLEPALWAFIAVAGAAAVVRTGNVVRQERSRQVAAWKRH